MNRIAGTTIVAYWLVGASTLALARLAARSGDLLANPAGWRAAAGPLVVALLGPLAARQLLREQPTVHLPVALLAIQLLAFSVGPVAYRLDAGPFLRLGATSTGVFADYGNDARLLLILGSANQIPSGLAINFLALAFLVFLIAAHRAASDAPAG